MLTTLQWFEAFSLLFYIAFGFIAISIILVLIKKGFRIMVSNRKFKFQNHWINERQMLDWLKQLKPNEFEEYIGHLYSKLGYTTRINGGSNDGGVDVIAEKNGVKSLIQCKRYNLNTVSVHDIRDFYGALTHDLANGKGIFITTNIFSQEAERFADGKPIELIDGFKLIKLIKIAENKTDIDTYDSISDLCPNCGGHLVPKVGKFGKFKGCSNYPDCKFSKGV
jgi:restriction system protein